MSLNPRLSFLVTTLCAFAFLFASPMAPAAPKKEKTVGTVKIEGGGTVKINGDPAQSGAELKCKDTIETTGSVTITLSSGKEYVLKSGSKVTVVCLPNGAVKFLLSSGGIDGDPGDTIDPLPFLAAFGFGNYSFPSIGGGSSATNGKIPVFNASGVLVGYAVTDSNGKVIYYTDTTGKVLALSGPNGTPVSSVFGPGATGASLM